MQEVTRINFKMETKNNKYSEEYRKKNKERIKSYRQLPEVKARAKDYYRKYYLDNKSRIKKHQEKNKERIKIRARKYYQQEEIKNRKRIYERKYYRKENQKGGKK